MKRRKGIRINRILSSDSGFTLVELIVVLVLMVIIIAVAIAGGLGWQEWAQFNHEEAMAEEIFFAAQNQLTEYDSSDALEDKVIAELLKVGSTNGSYDTSITLSKSLLGNIVYKNEGLSEVKYTWDDVWKSNQNSATQEGTMIRLKADKDDYKAYLDGTLVTPGDTSKLGAKILFDIVSSYVSDTGALNAAITLEFSPDAGQVFSVCYSDKVDTLLYEGESAGSGKTFASVMNRTITSRKSNMMGYFSVAELAQRIKGRGATKSNLKLELENSNFLLLKVEDEGIGSEALRNGDKLLFNIYNGQTSGNNNLMSFTLDYALIPTGSIANVDSITPMKVKFSMLAGKYSGKENVVFRVPVWREDNNIYIVLDAADVQAQTLSFADSIYFGKSYSSETPDSGEESFRNTYSFYRFGLADLTNYIFADVTVNTYDAKITQPVEGGSNILHDNGFRGVCTCFEEYTKEDENVDIELKNARHFYNMRYETDYKRDGNESLKETFKLTENISWASFVGKNNDPNYFLNSYDTTMDNTSKVTSGINYDGMNYATRSLSGESPRDTSVYPFPGFRKLDENDTFTQENPYVIDSTDNSEQNTTYTISDLTLSISANIVYGIYGESVKTSCVNNNIDDYSSILGEKSETDSSSVVKARSGELPLGLFAENFGSISNIILNRHVVDGLEVVNNSVVYTCMAGGFAGNNIGTLENLTLLDEKDGDDSEDSKAGVSRITGRTDVGGILGRQSFVKLTDDETVVLKGLINYASVEGLENVGGIIGRVFVNYDEPSSDMYKNYYFDGYEISKTNGLSMSGTEVKKAEKVSIEDSLNFGYIQGITNEKFLENKTIDGKSVKDLKNSFIGGIAGVTMDGCLYSKSNPLPDAYLDGMDENIKIKNCYSYSLYDIVKTEVESKLFDETEHPSLISDNYVGGVVGYGRLTAIENCNKAPDSEFMLGEVTKSFVFGNRYIGGIFGCAEACRLDKGDSADYTVTNYSNVIGRMFVGGIAGGNGIGNIDSSKMNYKNPSENKAGPLASVEIDSDLLVSALNKGAVLTLHSDNPFIPGIMDEWKEEDYDSIVSVFNNEDLTGFCGGIVGLNASTIRDCNNIQSEQVKIFVSNLVKGNNESGFYSDTLTTESVDHIINTSNYGGNACGGIVGASIGGSINVSEKNDNTDYESKVDALVFGQDYVGGCAGLTKDASVNNVMPSSIDENSTGLLVVGSDVVGGFVGRIGGDFSNYNQSVSAYRVIGRYGVGGAFGNVSSNEDIDVSIDPQGSQNIIEVDGIAYVGGYVGVSDHEDDISLKGYKNIEVDLDDTKVTGNYFVGGMYGCIAGGDKTVKEKDFKLGSNITVQADAFAGGISGLYLRQDVSDEFCKLSNDYNDKTGSLIKLANEKLKKSGAYVEFADAYKVIVVSDIEDENVFKNIASGRQTVTFSDYDASGSNTVTLNVSAKIFAGGLFGFVPDDTYVTVKGFVNNGNIKTTQTIGGTKSIDAASGQTDSVKYSYLGGVIGRVPAGMKLVNCANIKTGSDVNSSGYYASSATYIGGLTEVNDGFIGGTGEKDDNGKIIGYLEASVNRNYAGQKIGAIAGINGTPNSDVTIDDSGKVTDDSTGVIRYCKNIGTITATGDGGLASGIAAAANGSSIIIDCINQANITSSKVASGVLGEALDGSVMANGSNNEGTIKGSTSVGGIIGVDNGTDSIEIRKCENTGDIESSGAEAGGIIGKSISDDHSASSSKIIGCINHGSVDASTSAAGIIAESSSAIALNDLANTGVITIGKKHPLNEANSESINAAGIIVDSNGKGVLDTCRNYGTGLYYGITKENAKSIIYSFDASNATKHIGEVASGDGADKYANFYIGDSKTIPRDKKFKATMSYYEYDGDEPVEITNYVFSPGQKEDDIKHNSETCGSPLLVTESDSYKLKYTILPVLNYQGLENTYVDIDELQIVWDNYAKNDIDEFMTPSLNYSGSMEYTAYLTNAISNINTHNAISYIYSAITGQVNTDSDYLRKQFGLSTEKNLLGVYTTQVLGTPNNNKGYGHDSDKNEYFLDYTFAVYKYMKNNYKSYNANKYIELIYSFADKYGYVAYENANKATYDMKYYLRLTSESGAVCETKSTQNQMYTTNVNGNNATWTDTVKISQLNGIQIDGIIVQKPEGFDENKISKIEVIVYECPIPIGIRAFKWKEAGTSENVLMEAYSPEGELIEDPYAGVEDALSLMNVLANSQKDVYESETSLFLKENISSTVTKYDVYIYDFDTSIKSLDIKFNYYTNNNSYFTDFNEYKTSEYRKRMFNEFDGKYVDFIDELKN
ncbi:MAG TPA: hypothetical protein DEO83_06590 [Lachnospiraceae bacterium]|nr:hypothetical protein [Lachnospiraceae bacterium]